MQVVFKEGKLFHYWLELRWFLGRILQKPNKALKFMIEKSFREALCLSLSYAQPQNNRSNLYYSFGIMYFCSLNFLSDD